jgi:hypothetical protein
MNNIRTHTHRTSKKNICYRECEGEHAHIHARVFVRSALFFSPSNGRRAKEEKKKKKKETRSSNSNEGKQPSKRTLSLYVALDEKIEQQG